ncbi:hypothetical protein D3C73_1174910 [compost metagenome]
MAVLPDYSSLPTITTVSYKSEVYATVIFEAIHNWPGVTSIPGLEEVAYLQYPHRHRFFIRVYSRVTHSDRDVEFIWLAHQVEKFLKGKFPDGELGAMSCEMIGQLILENFESIYKVDCSEDDENGAIMERVLTHSLDLDNLPQLAMTN